MPATNKRLTVADESYFADLTRCAPQVGEVPGSVISEETLEVSRVADSEAKFDRRLERPRTDRDRGIHHDDHDRLRGVTAGLSHCGTLVP